MGIEYAYIQRTIGVNPRGWGCHEPLIFGWGLSEWSWGLPAIGLLAYHKMYRNMG